MYKNNENIESKFAISVSKEVILSEKECSLNIDNYLDGEVINSKYQLIDFEDSIEKVTYTNKVKSSQYKSDGLYPIIDQSESFIAGYWDNENDVFKISKPVTIFGDHTRCFKYVDFDFVLGADGVKILQPINDYHPKFYYYLVRSLNIKNLGYSRHYKELKNKRIPLPPMDDQIEILSKIENIENEIQQLKQNIDVKNNEIVNHIDSIWNE